MTSDEDDRKNEDDLKNENNLKNEDNLKITKLRLGLRMSMHEIQSLVLNRGIL